MSFLVVMDSCGELTEDMKESGHFASVPFLIDIAGSHFVDNERFDMKRFLRLVKESPTVAKPHVRRRSGSGSCSRRTRRESIS